MNGPSAVGLTAHRLTVKGLEEVARDSSGSE